MKAFILTSYFLLLFFVANAQQSDTLLIQAKVQAGDTLMVKQLKEVEVYPKFRNRYQARRYYRLVRYVKKVYPYAQIAAEKMKEYEQILADIPEPSDQRKIMKQIEAEIYEEWEDDLKNLTYLQGGILLKLIDRQTGEASYTIVQEFRGNFRAFFYQSFARIFGFNLKERYNPKGNNYDMQIEHIVHLIETDRL
ncbi:MAG: DUF4294 domain-containing protein [Bacteroidales bacterium]|nr:DUF4294 domain-containing protein [Bacteroidales bacterium]RLD38416.1 MAG: DUF4294 domain-containing protein [Bacteroidota bacterium]